MAGFASASDVYERGRPDYPTAFVDELAAHWGLRPGALAVDLAAGTGKLTRQLSEAGARVLAVEPSAAMRAQCALSSPDVAVVAGAAADIPLGEACADLITVAQAFHWFEPRRALHEAARVLRPGGTLALVWNERDTSVDWMARLERILRGVGRSPHRPGDIVAADFDGDRHFGPFSRFIAGHQVEMKPEQVCDLVASRSYVRVSGEPERRAVLAEVAALVEPLGATVPFPYVTRAYCAEARPDGCGCAKEG